MARRTVRPHSLAIAADVFTDFHQRQAQPASAIPPAPIAPTFGNSWPLFLWLVATAAALYFAKRPILVVAAIAGFCKSWIWLSRRYPGAMYFVTVFNSALIGGRRQR